MQWCICAKPFGFWSRVFAVKSEFMYLMQEVQEGNTPVWGCQGVFQHWHNYVPLHGLLPGEITGAASVRGPLLSRSSPQPVCSLPPLACLMTVIICASHMSACIYFLASTLSTAASCDIHIQDTSAVSTAASVDECENCILPTMSQY